MTDEFKSTLFSYLTGNLKHEEGTHEEIIKEINEIPREKWEGFTPPRNEIENFKYEGLIKVKNSQLFVEYGGFKTKDGDIRGIITILTSDFIPIKTFYQYDSGTYLRYIQCMRQEDDGTFYAVDCPDFPQDENWSSTQTEKRFIMLNNFTQQINEEYVLKLNKSYIMPYKSLYCRKMFKDPNSAHYVLCCSVLTGQSNPTYAKTRIIELKINVGSSNEWSYNDTNDGYLMGDSYVEFDSDSKSFVEVILTLNQTSNRNVGIWTKNFNDSSYTYKNVYAFSFQPYIDSFTMKNQSVFLNKDEIYFVQNNQHWGISGSKVSKYIGLYYYNIKTENRKTIYEKYLGEYDYCNLESIYITQNNNDLYIQYNTNINNEEEKADYYFQRLDSEWKPIKIAEQKFFFYNRRGLYVNNNFNLINVFMYMLNPQSQYWTLYSLKENYNSSNYNGEPYVNDNALIPNSAELYSDSELIFARNLYNKTINNNVTVSTVEVPNNYLNDVDITSKNLLSETNLTMIADTNVMQKNIYETVFLNFINVVQVLNKDTETINRQAGVYLNAKINDEKGYDNAKITKVRIRNMEGGETIQSIQIDYPNETVSSTNPQLTNSANAELNSIRIDGKTVQNGTPTPDEPVEIKNVKGYSNLFNVPYNTKTGNGMTLTYQDNKIILNGTTTALTNFWSNDFSILLPKGTYTLSSNVNLQGKGAYALKDSVGNIVQSNLSTPSTFTLSEDKVASLFLIQINQGVTFNNQEFQIQLVEGNKEKPFIPFGNNCLKINSNGKNLFNYKDTKKVDEGIKVDEEGWITVTYDNSQSSSVKYFNYFTNNLDLTEKTKYQIVTEVKKVDGELILYSVSNNQGQMKNNISYEFNGLQTNLIYRDINETYDNFNNSFYALRTYVRFAQGKKGSITFRLSVLKDISTTNEFAYTPYNTNSIFLNLKDNELAENDFVKIANNYGTIYKTKETLELTGDEPSWLENFATKGLFQITLDNINADLTKVHAISTHFIGNKGSDIAKPTDYVDNSICTYSGNRIFFRSNSYANNLNGFKQFIKDQKTNGTPVVIQYDLLKPYTIDLGMQDSIYSYEGTTNISVDDELTPNIEVNYRLDGNYCILTVGIKVKEPLYQLEFISNDETNVYHTVDLSNLEVGKYYVIKQKLEVL